jgi:membrane protein implicated in regulation of membrane protease activity
MDMQWWHWVAIGLVLAGLELATPGGFFIIFFGLGAIAVGFLSLIGVSGPLWAQWLLFSFCSVVSLMLFRNPLLQRLRQRDAGTGPVDALTGEIALPTEDIAPGVVGRAELRGTTWNARNVGTDVLARGQRCVVARVDGLLISLKREGER